MAPLLGALLGSACATEVAAPTEPIQPVDVIDDPPVESTSEALTIDEYIDSLDEFAVADPVARTEIGCEEGTCPEDGQEGKFQCSYRRYTETARREAFVALQPNSATLWPGALLQGRDGQNGVLTPLGLEQAPLTFSVSLENLGGSPVGSMTAPSLSAFREERNRILAADVTGATPASLDFEIAQIHSESHLALMLGAGLTWPGAGSISASFNFASDEKITRILVDFSQAYYTIDVDTPTRPSQFFDPAVTVEDLMERTDETDPPVFVQSITYGRRAIFSIESTESASDLKAALEAAYSGTLGAPVGAEISISVEHRRVLEQSTIRAFVFGGSGAEATGIIHGFEGLVTYIQNGGDYSRESPGAPIGYKLAYLTGATTEFAIGTDYTERDCFRNRVDMDVSLDKLQHISSSDSGGTLEIFGYVRVRYPTAESPVMNCDEGGATVDVWSLPDDSWVTVPEGEAFTPDSPIFVTIEDVAIGPDAKLCLSTHLWEEDGATRELSGDDDYGRDERLISLSPDTDWQGPHVLQPRGEGDRAVDVHVGVVGR